LFEVETFAQLDGNHLGMNSGHVFSTQSTVKYEILFALKKNEKFLLEIW
jgi:hypothetical protein